MEKNWLEAQTLCKTINEQLNNAQSQYETLDKKYSKAKKLLKDFQQKWVHGVNTDICFKTNHTSGSQTGSRGPKIDLYGPRFLWNLINNLEI